MNRKERKEREGFKQFQDAAQLAVFNRRVKQDKTGVACFSGCSSRLCGSNKRICDEDAL
jgi:hypothetical protein